MNLVFLSSPYSGDIKRNVFYARACVRDCLMRNESPFASHLLFTQDGILRDDVAAERERGTLAGMAWMPRADYCVFYTDYGWSAGMKAELAACFNVGDELEFHIRALHGDPQLPPHKHFPEYMSARIKASAEP